MEYVLHSYCTVNMRRFVAGALYMATQLIDNWISMASQGEFAVMLDAAAYGYYLLLMSIGSFIVWRVR
jgi:hypothetical protein